MHHRILAASFVLLLVSSCQTAAPPPPDSHAIACDASGDTLGACALVETDAQRRLRGTRPEYDVDRHCQALADSVGDDPLGLIKASCLDGELNARVRIAAMTIRPDVFDRCEKEAENPRGGSYLDFERCATAPGG